MDPFIIFQNVFLAANKNTLPRRQVEVNAIAGPVWHGLSEEQQLVYQTLARLEREAYERDNPAHALQHHGQQLICPTGQIPHIQNAPFMVNTNEMLYDVYATQGQSIVGAQHRYAALKMQLSYQWPPSTSVSATFAEHSGPQVHNHATYYHDASGQDFTIMNLQYLAPVPTITTTAHGPNPPTAAFYRNELDKNTDVHGVSQLSPSSSMEVGSSTSERESPPYYEHPSQSTRDGLQYHQRQP
ncbi:hypothetical protein F5146DRAFT_1161298 [Armillaria mellea]|nr:hypothetical protein F5146DRAFT_1161298 [Armillaria mellea]